MKTNEEVLNELKQHISEISDERYTLRKIKPTDINDDYYEMQDLIKQDLLEQAHRELHEVCVAKFEYLDPYYIPYKRKIRCYITRWKRDNYAHICFPINKKSTNSTPK